MLINSFFFLFESLLSSLRNGRQAFHDSVYAFLIVFFFKVYIHTDPDELVTWDHLDEWVDKKDRSTKTKADDVLGGSEWASSSDFGSQCVGTTSAEPQHEVLDSEFCRQNKPVNWIVEKSLENVQFIGVNDSGIDRVEQVHQNKHMEADRVHGLAIGGVPLLSDQVEWLLSEHGAAEVHQDSHHEDLIDRVKHDLSPEFGIHDKIFPADSWPSLVLPVRLGSERDGT